MANRAMSGVGGILMRCFLSSRATVYVLTDFVPLNNVAAKISLCEMFDWRAAVLNIKQESPRCITPVFGGCVPTCVKYFLFYFRVLCYRQ